MDSLVKYDAEIRVYPSCTRRPEFVSLQALTEVPEHKPEVIILDLEMPVMNGRAFYRALRAEGHQVPVLILSAYGAQAARTELGAEAAVDKPFEPEELVERASALIGQK